MSRVVVGRPADDDSATVDKDGPRVAPMRAGLEQPLAESPVQRAVAVEAKYRNPGILPRVTHGRDAGNDDAPVRLEIEPIGVVVAATDEVHAPYAVPGEGPVERSVHPKPHDQEVVLRPVSILRHAADDDPAVGLHGDRRAEVVAVAEVEGEPAVPREAPVEPAVRQETGDGQEMSS